MRSHYHKTLSVRQKLCIPEATGDGRSQVAKNAFNIVLIVFIWSVHDPCSIICDECYVRTCCCCKMHEFAHCVMTCNLAAEVFVLITTRPLAGVDTLLFQPYWSFAVSCLYTLFPNKNWPITLRMKLRSEEILKRANCDLKFLLQ